jgi:nicotinate-nucleotide adenylyltransferase
MIIANQMVESRLVDQVWFVVSPQNPFKERKSLLHEFDRLDMVRASIGDQYQFRASDIEFNMPKPSYTIDTLTLLHEKHPDDNFSIIVGEDNLASFHKWKNAEQILKQYSLLVYPRKNSKPSDLNEHESVQMVRLPEIDVSASFIRQSIKEGRSVRYLVTDPVLELIESRGYYQ